MLIHGTELGRKCVPITKHMLILGTEVWNIRIERNWNGNILEQTYEIHGKEIDIQTWGFIETLLRKALRLSNMAKF